MKAICGIVACLAILRACYAVAAAEPFAPTSAYEVRDIEDWTVRVHRDFLTSQPELSKETLRLLETQLYQIKRVVSEEPRAKLQQIVIWVEENEPHHPCMAYHPDADWLRDHDMNPDKARCVEVANARAFLSWTKDQPWMVLHELAHGYHHQFLENGFENQQLATAQKHGVEAGRYGPVLHIRGGTRQHYGATNPMEYFAEGTEAYFGTNDFFPFVAAELRDHDPELFSVLEEIWGARKE